MRSKKLLYEQKEAFMLIIQRCHDGLLGMPIAVINLSIPLNKDVADCSGPEKIL